MPQVELEIVRGQAQRRRRRVATAAFLIGASSECDLVLAAQQFPEVYACLIVRDNGITLRHLGVGPELIVNGRQEVELRLLDGDRLEAGPYEFILHISQRDDGAQPGAVPRCRRAASRWTTAHIAIDSTAMRAAEQLRDDIRAALTNEPRAIRRPA